MNDPGTSSGHLPSGGSPQTAGAAGEQEAASLPLPAPSRTSGLRPGSLGGRLLALLSGILLVTLLVIGASVFLFVSANEEQAWQGRQREAGRYAGERVSTFIGRVQDSLGLVALMESDTLATRPKVMDDALQQTPALLEVIRLDSRGNVVASASRGTPVLANLFTIPQSTWFLEAKAGRSYLGGVQISTTREPYLILAVPAADSAGGAVAGRLSMNVLWDVVEAIEFGETGQAYVVDQDGQVIAHTDPEVALSRTSLEGRPEMAAIAQAPGNEWSGAYRNFQGNQVVAVTAPVAGTDWVVITELLRSEALATSQAALLIVGGGLLAFGLLVVLVSNRFLRRLIVQPMEKLWAGAQRIGRGDLSHRIEISRDDEVGQLAHGFNDMVDELQRLYQELTVRNRELARRTRYLEATNTIARSAASELHRADSVRGVREGLLSRLVASISDQLGFYHAGVFLFDPSGEWVVLQAASSEGGQRMLARGHRLKLGVGIVGYVAQQGEPRVALDVDADAVFFDNPDLPETRSEMALPLRARGEMIGVLDVQSVEPGAFSQEDVGVLQTLADQVALAISNAQLFQQLQESLEAERRAHGQLGREAWRELLRAQSNLGYQRDGRGLSLAGEGWQPQAEMALRTGKTVQGSDGSADVRQPFALAIPIQVHGKVIGVIDAYKSAEAKEWTPEQILLIETLSQQLALALDSARLHEDTQRHALEDRLLGQITARVRETLDVDTVLRTAVREIGKALNLPRVEIRLGNGVARPGNGQPPLEGGQVQGLPKEGEHAGLD